MPRLDKIIINDLHLFAYHGVNLEEKINGQNFYLDITAHADLSKASRSARFVPSSTLFRAFFSVFHGPPVLARE